MEAGGTEVQGQPQLQGKFEPSLDYLGLCFKRYREINNTKVEDKMAPCSDLHSSSSADTLSWSLVWPAGRAKCYGYLKPGAGWERMVAAEGKEILDELKLNKRELAEAQNDSIFK